tara:strand:- start:224 stop:604 length:381 start_codon:yes stop_codon:yes gene_type:complete
MRHALAVLLITLLSVQTTWASVVSYGKHESGQTQSSLGHHAHDPGRQSVVLDLTGMAEMGTNTWVDSITGMDTDCPACHAGCAIGIPGMQLSTWPKASFSQPVPPLPGHFSVPVKTPDRPDWVRPA